VSGLCGVALSLVSGALSDRIGRRLMMLIPGAILLALILPSFFVISHYRTAAALLGATALLASLGALSMTPNTIWLAESLPPAIRSAGVATIYAISASAFGGTTQYIVTWLIKATGNPMAPAWYWTSAAIIGIIALCLIRETAPRKVAHSSS